LMDNEVCLKNNDQTSIAKLLPSRCILLMLNDWVSIKLGQ